MFEEVSEVMEMFRNAFPLSFLFFIPILIALTPVGAANEFSVYKMQRYDLQGTSFGSKNFLINMEARPVGSSSMTRRCIVARLEEVTLSGYRDWVSQNAGGLVILIPENIQQLSEKEKKHLQNLEEDLLVEESGIPVYFAPETEELAEIYESIKNGASGDQAATAWQAFLGAATANGFQMVMTGPAEKPLTDFPIASIQGRLSGSGIEEQLPSIVIVAHYDSFGVAPGLAQGADSNGSGVVVLMELARLFSKLFTNSRTHAKYNLVFLLSGGGKFNYQGTKRWIEDNLELDANVFTDAAFVLCLDSLGADQTLNLHVSKPPKEGSAGAEFLKNLEELAKSRSPAVKFNMVHKKINLADEMLAWEHERFSIKRLQAFTLSHLDSHKSPLRSSILDTKENVNVEVLNRNVGIIAESLAAFIYNTSTTSVSQLFSQSLGPQASIESAMLNYLIQESRCAQLVAPEHSLITTLQDTMSRYLKDVKISTHKADKRDPEFLFYSGSQYTMNAYNVKPAVFDLFLAAAIAAYLVMIWFLSQNMNVLFSTIKKYVQSPQKVKSQ
ncbi:hypothetical protein LOTGIDRAFT_207615 [Lottia gigantea]|uniref:Nicalin n=1 Tax=Lottia gigantea TaxID=225164 RepID=V4CLX7_LOTGI|nr:hypothetical protein LOTGIDRAFT_207615 [Lottia gigantea]ESP03325.1 hypothetical protein LOTGIDRAFT_207615 [Lottia gigantea]